ncbi:MAG: TonB-dependent receptor [Wenzhouxiangella sp.]|nr:MAG: TonB-dependent receptor [Wenzhouxiangella sp.]
MNPSSPISSRRLFVLVAAAATCLPFSAWADEAAETEEALDRISVTAERGRERETMEVPQAVDTITRLELDEQLPIDLTQAIQRQPSVGLGPSGEVLSFWQQGFTLRGLGSQRVLTLTDGVRLSGQGTGYGGGSLSIYDTFSVERIEILRGPNSVLYGTDAFGGVINVITRQPRRRDQAGFNGGVAYAHDSAYNLNRTSAFVDAGNERVDAVFGGSYSTNDNPRLADGTRATSGATDKASGFARVNIEVNPGHTLSLLGNISRDTDVEIEDSGIPFGPVGVGPLRFQFPLYQRSLLGAQWQSLDPSPTVAEFYLGVYWQQIRRQFDRTTPEVFFPPPPPTRVESVRVQTNDRINTYEINPRLRFDLGERMLTVGADFGYDTSVGPEIETREQLFPPGPPSPGLVPGPTPIQRVDAEQYRAGLYVQDNWSFAQRWELISGLRLDYFSVEDDISGTSDSETGLSGNLAVVFERTPEHMLYANLGTGFRAPDLAERYQRAVVSVVQRVEILGNPELDSERSLSVDVGSKWLSRTFNGEVALFYNRVSDYIVEQVVQPFPIVEQAVNTGTVELYGWELSGAWRSGSFELFGNASRTYAPSDRELIRVDGGRLNYGAAYRFAGPWGSDGRVELLGRTTLSSRDLTELGREDTGTDRVDYPSFTAFELRTRMDIALAEQRRLRLVAGIRNLTDRAYVEPFFDQVQPERSLYGSAQFLF